VYVLFQAIASGSDDFRVSLKSAGAFFQYLTALSIFVKVLLLYFDLPRHYLQVAKRDDN
jgi:hypothetical protein